MDVGRKVGSIWEPPRVGPHGFLQSPVCSYYNYKLICLSIYKVSSSSTRRSITFASVDSGGKGKSRDPPYYTPESSENKGVLKEDWTSVWMRVIGGIRQRCSHRDCHE